jgi:hypothetical protein
MKTLDELCREEEAAALVKARAEIAAEAVDPVYIARHKKRMAEIESLYDNLSSEAAEDEDEDEEGGEE